MQEQFHEDRERNLKRFFKDSKNNNFDDESNNMILDEEDNEKMYLPKAIMDRVQVCLHFFRERDCLFIFPNYSCLD